MAVKTFQLKRRLTKAANRHVSNAGLSLAPACEHLVTKLINTGVKRMETIQVVEDESKIRLAEDNLKRFVMVVKKEAFIKGTFPVVEGDSFQDALRKLQSFWPYR